MKSSSQVRSQLQRVVVTTSWDDDDRGGLRVAQLLQAHGIAGTFYVPTAKLGEGNAFSAADLRNLVVDGFEIGAHTVSHPILPTLDAARLAFEVGHCKEQLQQMLGQEVTTFCYPRGRFNQAVISAVRHAGYRGARGTLMLSTGHDFSPFAIPTTLQAYPHTRSNYLRNFIRQRAVSTLLRNIPELLRYDGWFQLARRTFDRVLENGGVWHLYGHPWEIEKLNLWPQLHELFQYVGGHKDVAYLTNASLVGAAQRKEHSVANKAATTLAH